MCSGILLYIKNILGFVQFAFNVLSRLILLGGFGHVFIHAGH